MTYCQERRIWSAKGGADAASLPSLISKTRGRGGGTHVATRRDEVCVRLATDIAPERGAYPQRRDAADVARQRRGETVRDPVRQVGEFIIGYFINGYRVRWWCGRGRCSENLCKLILREQSPPERIPALRARGIIASTGAVEETLFHHHHHRTQSAAPLQAYILQRCERGPQVHPLD